MNNDNATAKQIQDALNAINTAKGNLKGQATNKTDLQNAVDAADTTKASENYTNADSDKQQAYTDAITAGQDVLKNANATQEQVENALTAITNAKNGLNGDSKKTADKSALQQAVKEAPTFKTTDSKYYNGSTNAQKAYDDAVNAGQKVLDNAEATASDITNALNAINNAKTALDGTTTDKSKLKPEIDSADTTSENYTNADSDKKKAYDDALAKGKALMADPNAKQADVDAAVTALQNAKKALNGDEKKSKDKSALQTAVNEAPSVRTDNYVYYNGSADAKKAYDDAVNAGQDVLNNANATASEINKALSDINTAKSKLDGTATDKTAANTAIDNALSAKKSAITNATNIDQATKDSLIKEATDAADKAKTAINNAKTNDDVAAAQKNGTDAINSVEVPSLDDAKSAAIKSVNDAATAQKETINSADNLTDTEKQALVKQVDDAVTAAKGKINGETTNDGAAQAGQEGVDAIKKIAPTSLADAKKNANDAIDQALNSKKSEINSATNIDQATKNKLITDATQAADSAKDAVNKATTNADVANEQTKGIEAIKAVKVPGVIDSQNTAKSVIDEALNNKKKEINDADNLSSDQKTKLINDATNAAKAADDAIDQATTAEAIKKAQDEGTTNINNVKVPSLEDAKKAASDAVDTAATNQKDLINKSNNLSDAEKQALVKKVDDAANAAKDKINAAPTNDDAAQAGQVGVNAIGKIVPTSLDDAQQKAATDIDQAAQAAKNTIENTNGLTADQKKAAEDDIDQAAKTAKDNIASATDDQGIKNASDAGKLAINKITAKAAIDAAAAAKKNEIAKASLTSDEAKSLNDKVDQAATQAKKAIDQATTIDDVTSAQNTGIQTIKNISVPATSDTKAKAKADIDKALNDKYAEINRAVYLSDDQKNTLKKQAKNEADKAKANIDQAQTNDDVAKASQAGVAAIKNVTVPAEPNFHNDSEDKAKKLAEHKSTAADEINQAAKGKKSKIDHMKISDQEKSKLKDLVDQKAADAIKEISNAKSLDEVNTARTAGLKEIESVAPNSSDLPDRPKAKKNSKNRHGKGANVNGQNGNAGFSANVHASALAASNKNNKGALPQTGENESNLGLVGLAIASLGALLGLAISRKRKN